MPLSRGGRVSVACKGSSLNRVYRSPPLPSPFPLPAFRLVTNRPGFRSRGGPPSSEAAWLLCVYMMNSGPGGAAGDEDRCRLLSFFLFFAGVAAAEEGSCRVDGCPSLRWRRSEEEGMPKIVSSVFPSPPRCIPTAQHPVLLAHHTTHRACTKATTRWSSVSGCFLVSAATCNPLRWSLVSLLPTVPPLSPPSGRHRAAVRR